MRGRLLAAGALVAGVGAAAAVRAGTTPDQLPIPARGIKVVAHASCPPGYDRAQFGNEPTSTTRARALAAFAQPDGTVWDTWNQQAVAPATVQIDHVRALKSAWCFGAAGWTADVRRAFARDPGNLIPTRAATNDQKSDQDPGTWQPPSPAARCDYALRWLTMTRTYHLAALRADLVAAAADYATCPG